MNAAHLILPEALGMLSGSGGGRGKSLLKEGSDQVKLVRNRKQERGRNLPYFQFLCSRYTSIIQIRTTTEVKNHEF